MILHFPSSFTAHVFKWANHAIFVCFVSSTIFIAFVFFFDFDSHFKFSFFNSENTFKEAYWDPPGHDRLRIKKENQEGGSRQ